MKLLRFAAIPSALLLIEASVLSAAAWPPVSREELAMTDDPANPGAAAIILSREVTTDDVKGISTEYRRIKVLTDDGKKYADLEIPYIEHFSKVEDIQARTIRPDGTTVDFQGPIFDRTVLRARRTRVQVKALALPEVQRGSILEYSYAVRYREKAPDILKNPGDYLIKRTVVIPSVTWEVQEDLFTRRARFLMHPFLGAGIQWTLRGAPTNTTPERQSDGAIALEVKDLPAFQEEEYMPPEKMLRSQLGFYYQVGPYFSPSYWGDIGQSIGESYAPFLGDPKKLKPELAGLVSPDDAPEAQLRKLYARVQQIRDLSFERSKTGQEVQREALRDNKSVEDVLKHGYGSGREINLTLVALSRAAGFEAALLLVASRRSNLFWPELPDRSQLNANIAWVRAGGKDYYLDPATIYCPFDLLPWEETGAIGIAVGHAPIELAYAKFTGLIRTPTPDSSGAIIKRMANLQLNAEGAVEGTVSVRFMGQEALERRISARNQDEAARRKTLQDAMKGWISNVATVELQGAVNWENSDEPLHADFSVKVPDFAVSTGRRQLFRPSFFASTKTFQSTTRIHDIYFPYPSQDADDVTWILPEGFLVESLPDEKKQKTNFGNYSLTVSSVNGGIQVQRRLTSEAIYLPKQYYAAIRAYLGVARLGDESHAVLASTGVQDAK